MKPVTVVGADYYNRTFSLGSRIPGHQAEAAGGHHQQLGVCGYWVGELSLGNLLIQYAKPLQFLTPLVYYPFYHCILSCSNVEYFTMTLPLLLPIPSPPWVSPAKSENFKLTIYTGVSLPRNRGR